MSAMPMDLNHEIAVRTQKASEAIQRSFDTEAGEFGATLFVEHHVAELDDEYWRKHLGTNSPTASQVLGLLALSSHWGDDEDGIDVFDFALPGEASNYVLSVRFDGDGEVEEISMES
ncbi:MAG: DUF2004 domain-containing protein [Acidovorax sp.]|nr:MAG: DUF2004 domain-containing protein [Acidovorax sp.]